MINNEKDKIIKEQQLYSILINKEWYSYGLKFVQRSCGIGSVKELHDIACSLSNQINDKINFFSYNGHEYIGLETRRLDYEYDKRNGTNKVEKLISKGHYKPFHFVM